MTTTNKKLTPNERKLQVLSEDCDRLSIYHLRYSPDIGQYVSYLVLEELKDRLKSGYQSISDNLTHGITIVVTHNEDDAIAALSFNTENDNFNKRVGIKYATQRLLNYYHKKSDDSWNYNEDMFITFEGLPKDADGCIEEITRYLSRHEPLLKRGMKVAHYTYTND